MARTPVLRVFHQLGPDRVIRTTALALWLGALLLQAMLWRPDLLHPTDLGSDSSNYAATAERAAVGHGIYALVEGDRPSPLDNPPEWRVPILSPPTISTAYLWQVALPEGVGMYLAWVAGIVAMAVLGQVVILAAPPVFSLLLIYWAPDLAVTAWSGNVNALIAPAAMFVWWASQRRERRWQVLAGALVAIAACVKLGPLFLGVWLVAQRRWPAVVSGAVAGLAMVAATVLITGPDALFDYLSIARSAVSEPTSLSIPGVLRDLGASEEVQAIGLPTALAVAVSLMFLFRTSPISFTAAILAMIFSTPVVRPETAVLAIAAAVAWLPSSSQLESEQTRLTRATLVPPVVAAMALGAVIVVVSLATGGTDRSTFAITNRTQEPVIVRFSLFIQRAQFGFLVRAGQTAIGWQDRRGASPPLASVWSRSCELLDVVELPRTGAVLDYHSGETQFVGEVPATAAFARYVPDCFANLVEYLETENPRVRTSSATSRIVESSPYYRSVAVGTVRVDRSGLSRQWGSR